jgi:hypothetical protein
MGWSRPQRFARVISSNGRGNEAVQGACFRHCDCAIGISQSAIAGVGVILLASTLLYLVPRTAILGAILLTGYLGGAAASKVRVQAGWFAVLFPVLLGVLLWGGLWLRDRRIRELLPNTIGNSS